MAELKRVNEYQYDPQGLPSQPMQNPLPDPEHQKPKKTSSYESTQRVPVSPARHLKRLSKMEKFLLSFILLAIIGVSVVTIQLRATITQVENEITSIQSQTVEKESEATILEQEKNELSRAERIKRIAEEKGLTINDDNLRKVN